MASMGCWWGRGRGDILNIKWFHSFLKRKRLRLKYARVLPACQPLIKSKSRHPICLPK